MGRTDNTLQATSGEDPVGAFLGPFQAARRKGRSFYKTNLKTSLSSTSAGVLTAGKALHPRGAKDHVSLP